MPYTGSLPCSLASRAQTNGNNKLKLALSDKADQAAKRTLLREAVQFYSSGLELAVPSDALNAALHCNRAHVQIMLGGWRSRTPRKAAGGTGKARRRESMEWGQGLQRVSLGTLAPKRHAPCTPSKCTSKPPPSRQLPQGLQ